MLIGILIPAIILFISYYSILYCFPREGEPHISHMNLITGRRFSSSPSTSGRKVIQYAQGVIRSNINLLNMLSDQDYCKSIENRSTVGAHFRHSHDHFHKVLFKDAYASGPILYDVRLRETDLEKNRTVAKESFEELLSVLDETSNLGDNVEVSFIADGVTGEQFTMPSTVSRELAFVSHHGIHHIATIKELMAMMSYTVDETVGRAPSTINNDIATENARK